MAEDQLSRIFAALADPTRRAILARLADGEATVNELAEPFPVSLQAISKHLKVLERAGLITRGRDAQWRPCRLEAAPLDDASEWIERYRATWRPVRPARSGNPTNPAQTERSGRAQMSETEFVIEPGRQDIIIKRVFDAPPDIVFKAFTDPALIPHWWGPAKYEVIVDRADVRPGGSWRFINRDPDSATEHAFKGVFHDIVAPERVVQTFEYEGVPGHVALETATLTEVDGRTRYVGVSVFQSVEDRDGMVQSGMQGGASESMDRLAELINNL